MATPTLKMAKNSTELISCPYSSLGCEAKLLKTQLEHHENTCTVEHLALAIKKINLLDKKIPPVVFKIENVSQDWYSPPFYSHSEGYKLCLKVSTNGDHVLVYVHLMRGEYNDDLVYIMAFQRDCKV